MLYDSVNTVEHDRARWCDGWLDIGTAGYVGAWTVFRGGEPRPLHAGTLCDAYAIAARCSSISQATFNLHSSTLTQLGTSIVEGVLAPVGGRQQYADSPSCGPRAC